MANCDNNYANLIGKACRIRACDGCADTVPGSGDWKYFGAMTTKSFDLAPDTVNSDADNTGAFTAGIVTGASLSISGDGEFLSQDKPYEYGVYRAMGYFVEELANSRQPSLWIMLDWGDMSIRMYANITAFSGEAPSKDLVTYSIEFQPADGNSVKFIRKGDVEVTGVTVSPKTLTIAVSDTVTVA